MRLVIEREGGFVVVESDDVTAVDVLSNGVEVSTREGKAVTLEREGHAASVALATAIAVRCGVLVEALAGQPSDGLEDALDDDPIGVAMAGLVRKHSTPMAVGAGAWVAGEPPKGGLWYVVARGGVFGCVAWDGKRFRDWCSETVVMDGQVGHLPTPLPPRR
jgi:hypothetical protein